MAAFLIGLIGVATSLAIGNLHLGIEVSDIFRAVLASNLAGLIGGTLTLSAERVGWIRARILTRGYRTWALLSVLYFGISLAGAPILRDSLVLAQLALPLIMSTGLMLNALFGPVQDWLMHRRQFKENPALRSRRPVL